jgi:hypothetical protein
VFPLKHSINQLALVLVQIRPALTASAHSNSSKRLVLVVVQIKHLLFVLAVNHSSHQLVNAVAQIRQALFVKVVKHSILKLANAPVQAFFNALVTSYLAIHNVHVSAQVHLDVHRHLPSIPKVVHVLAKPPQLAIIVKYSTQHFQFVHVKTTASMDKSRSQLITFAIVFTQSSIVQLTDLIQIQPHLQTSQLFVSFVISFMLQIQMEDNA